jgi:arylsulfatase A-like enzyme
VELPGCSVVGGEIGAPAAGVAREPPEGSLCWGIAAPAGALLAVAVADTAQMPAAALLQHAWAPFALLGHSIGQALQYCWPQLLCTYALAGLRIGQPPPGRARSIVRGLAGALGLTMGLTLCRTLATYPPFLGSAWVILVLGCGTLGCAAAPLALLATRRSLANAVAVAAALGFVALSLGNALEFENLYPSLHLTATQASLMLGGWLAVRALAALPSPRGRASALGLATLGVLPWLLGAVFLSGAFADELSLLRSHTALGRAATAYGVNVDGSRGEYTGAPDEVADLAYFNEHSRLSVPPLAAHELDRLDVLFISAEATRFDVTSSGDPASDLTPHLRQLVEQGAFDFTRAYSPSTGTMQSTGAYMGMGIPSSLHLEVWLRRWYGRLLDAQDTVAEAFQADGRDTFWIGHNHNQVFGVSVAGLNQGFARIELGGDDEAIRRRAVAQLAALHAAGRRFFGWVFFAAPHYPYEPRYPAMPAATAKQRYLQEVRYMDEQLGTLLDSLRASGTLEQTVVVFTADHGEEFREHGGTGHKTTVYTEVSHVPLVVWLPGVRGRTMTEPVSSAYVLPWLLASGSGHARSAALRGIERWTPMMRATGDAVVVELLGYDRQLASLIYPERKINADLFARSYEVYDLARDPHEWHDLRLDEQPGGADLIARMERYLEMRQQLRRFSVDPTQGPTDE